METDFDRASLRPPRPASYWPLWLIVAACAIGFLLLTRPAWLPSWLSGISVPPTGATHSDSDAVRPDRSVTAPTHSQNPAAAPSVRSDGAAVYRCSSAGSVTYSSDADCVGGKAVALSIDRSANIVKSTPAPPSASELVMNPPATFLATPANIGPRPRVESPECRWLDDRVAELDEAGRHPQSAWSQQNLREARRRARDRQFAIGC